MTGPEIQAYAREMVPRTLAEQGLTPTLTDPGQLERLAVLFDTPARKAAS